MSPIRSSRSLLPTIIGAALLAGSLDIISALTYYYLNTGKDPLRVLYYIASVPFGKGAYNGGTPMLLVGLLIHYLIATSFTILFFLLYPRLPFLRRSVPLTAILYGLFIWCVMGFVVLPLLGAHGSTKPKDVIIGMIILMLAIGLPLALLARRHYGRG